MLGNIPESDWRHFKRVHPLLLERFCQRTLDELAAVLRAGEGTAHERYCRAYALLAKRDKALARAFDDFRRSTAVMQLVIMRSGMNILTDSARSAVFRDGQIIVAMASGTEIRFPVAGNPRLARGTAAQLSRIELSPFGIHWPDLDEDLSFRGLLSGDHGQHQKVEPDGPANGRQPLG